MTTRDKQGWDIHEFVAANIAFYKHGGAAPWLTKFMNLQLEKLTAKQLRTLALEYTIFLYPTCGQTVHVWPFKEIKKQQAWAQRFWTDMMKGKTLTFYFDAQYQLTAQTVLHETPKVDMRVASRKAFEASVFRAVAHSPNFLRRCQYCASYFMTMRTDQTFCKIPCTNAFQVRELRKRQKAKANGAQLETHAPAKKVKAQRRTPKTSRPAATLSLIQ